MDAHKKVALKDGCAQTIVALLYNVRDKKMDEQKVVLVYNALNEQDG